MKHTLTTAWSQTITNQFLWGAIFGLIVGNKSYIGIAVIPVAAVLSALLLNIVLDLWLRA